MRELRDCYKSLEWFLLVMMSLDTKFLLISIFFAGLLLSIGNHTHDQFRLISHTPTMLKYPSPSPAQLDIEQPRP